MDRVSTRKTMTRASWTFTNLSIVLENMKRKKEIKESIHNFERRYDCETEDRERVSARHTKLKIEIRISTRRRRREAELHNVEAKRDSCKGSLLHNFEHSWSTRNWKSEK